MRAIKVYGPVILMIAIWWAIAFNQKSQNAPFDFGSLPARSPSEAKGALSLLSTMPRETLHQALAGDFSLMSHLIIEWDIDAQILQAHGIHAERLSPQVLIRSRIISRQLQASTPKDLAFLEQSNRLKTLVDDNGKAIDLSRTYKRFLPQTYVAASFLLALTPVEEIVALPRYLREQTQLYPKKLTGRIPLDIDRYNSEKLFQAKPEIAFIAHYSHPATTQALANQGILLYTMKNPSTLDAIKEELISIGNVVNRPLEAELLKIFIDAAFYAMDNRLQAHHLQSTLPSFLYLSYHQNFSIPTGKTLTGKLLERLDRWDASLDYVKGKEHGNGWSIPIDKEHIVNMNPACLIISVENAEAVRKEIMSDAALHQVAAVQNRRLRFIDETVQQSPSQYIVLAYYDLIQSLIYSP